MRVIGALIIVVVATHTVLELSPSHTGIRTDLGSRLLEVVLLAVLAAPALWLLVLGPLHHKRLLERRSAEKALRDTEERFGRLVKLAPDAIFVAVDGRVVYANDAGAKLLGAPSPASLLGRTFLDFIHPDYRLPVVARMETMRRTDEAAPPIVQKLVRLDGTLVEVEARACPIPFEGRPALLAMVRDISTRVRVEALARIQAAALDAVANQIIFQDREGRIEWINPAMAAVSGYSLEEVVGRRPSIFRSGRDGEAARDREIWTTLRRGEVWHGQFDSRRKDGTSYRADVMISPVKDERGEIVRYVAVGQDVTGRQRDAEQLRIQAAALDAAANAIIITDREFRIQWINEAFASLTGYALDEVAGQTPRFLRAGTKDAGTFDETAAALVAGRSWHGEVLNRRKDGSTYLADVTFTPVKDGRGEVVRFVGVGQDVTERRTLEAELRQAQKMEAVGQLAGGIAHDFNNLLTTILASSGLMEEQLAEEAPLREEVRLVRYSAERGAELTQKLLAFSRRQQLELHSLDLSALVADFSKMVRRVVREDVAVKLALADRAWVRADGTAVEEILMNLVTNARDAMPSGGTLSIATERRVLDEEAALLHGCPGPGQYAVVTVTDTGVGMDAETRRRLFEPFFTTKPVGSGTGLGMSMVYGLVKQHGGGISVYSELGKGSTFRVFFPVAEAAAESVAARAPRLSRGGTETILVVEDEPGLRRAAQRVLEKHGYTVVPAEDGVQALDILARRNGAIALVVSDVVMPRMGGVQLLRALREQGRRVPVLLTSGYTARDLEEASDLDGDVPFLGKPWTVADLLKRVREVLDAPRPETPLGT